MTRAFPLTALSLPISKKKKEKMDGGLFSLKKLKILPHNTEVNHV
jgi:hypothetical protein